MGSSQRILIVNPFGIGDVLFTTPMIAAIKQRSPTALISYLGNARTAPFLRNDSRLDKIFSYDRDEFVAVYRRSPWAFVLKWKDFIDGIKAERFDIVFDLSLNSGLGLALKLAGIPRRIGYDHKGRGCFLTERIPLKGYEGRHVAEYYLELLEILDTRHLSVQVSSVFKMELFSSAEDIAWADNFLKENAIAAGRAIILYPGGGASWGKDADRKRWPLENYAKLADKIVEKASCPIILMGDKNEIELCLSVGKKMRQPPLILAGGTTLGQAAALMKKASLVIANDGGPLHVAVASQARTVSIFGPVDSQVYGPYPATGHVVVTHELPCRPCYRNFRMSDCQHMSCLRALSVEDVFRKIERVL